MTITRRAGALGLALGLGLGLTSAWPALADRGSEADKEWHHEDGDHDGHDWLGEDDDCDIDFGPAWGLDVEDCSPAWGLDAGDDDDAWEEDWSDEADHEEWGGDDDEGDDEEWGDDDRDGFLIDHPVYGGLEPMTGWTPFTSWATGTNGWLGGFLGGNCDFFVGNLF